MRSDVRDTLLPIIQTTKQPYPFCCCLCLMSKIICVNYPTSFVISKSSQRLKTFFSDVTPVLQTVFGVVTGYGCLAGRQSLSLAEPQKSQKHRWKPKIWISIICAYRNFKQHTFFLAWFLSCIAILRNHQLVMDYSRSSSTLSINCLFLEPRSLGAGLLMPGPGCRLLTGEIQGFS